MKKVIIRTISAVFCVAMMLGIIPINHLYQFKASAASYTDVGWLWPIKNNYSMSRGYGHSMSYQPDKLHNGIDITASDGEPIYAAYGGVVIEMYNGCSHYKNPNDSCYYSLGNCVIIRHEVNGRVYTTSYQHLQKNSIKVKIGDTVAKGQCIGGAGASGSSTGVHLHFSITDEGSVGNTGNIGKDGKLIKKSLNRVPNNPINYYPGIEHTWSAVCKETGTNKWPGHIKYLYIGVNYPTPTPIPSNIQWRDAKVPEGSLSKGKAFGLYGIVTSNSSTYPLTNVTAVVKNTQTGAVIYNISVNMNQVEYNINTGDINKKILFNKLDDGYYSYTVTASAKDGNKKTLVTSNFTIGNPGSNQPDPPKEKMSDRITNWAAGLQAPWSKFFASLLGPYVNMLKRIGM